MQAAARPQVKIYGRRVINPKPARDPPHAGRLAEHRHQGPGDHQAAALPAREPHGSRYLVHAQPGAAQSVSAAGTRDQHQAGLVRPVMRICRMFWRGYA